MGTYRACAPGCGDARGLCSQDYRRCHWLKCESSTRVLGKDSVRVELGSLAQASCQRLLSAPRPAITFLIPLLTSELSLLIISHRPYRHPTALTKPKPYRAFFGVFIFKGLSQLGEEMRDRVQRLRSLLMEMPLCSSSIYDL